MGKKCGLETAIIKITKNMTVYIMAIQGLNWITSGLKIIMKMQPETNLPGKYCTEKILIRFPRYSVLLRQVILKSGMMIMHSAGL